MSASRTGPQPYLRRVGWGASLRARLDRARRVDLWLAAWILLAALVIAQGIAAENWQLVLTLAFVVAAGGLYLRWPTAGIAVLLVLWTFAPLFRRLLDYFAYSSAVDLLSLAPFLATAVLGVIAFRRARPPRTLLVVIGLVWLGLAIGIPAGISNPRPLLYGLFAYGSASLALLIGYADRQRGRLVMERILLVLLPIIVGYGLYQYFAPALPPWDQLWLQTTGLNVNAGSKAAGTFRFFSVLNSPGTLAGIMVLLASMIIVAPRLTWSRLIGVCLALMCLALVGIRSAWVALAGAFLVITFFSGGRMLARLLIIIALFGGLYLAAGGTSAGNQVTQQAATFGSLNQDASYRTRIAQVRQYGPQAIAAPLGHGIGSVGQAARLSTTQTLTQPFVDNGYLLLMWQVGPVGFLLVIGAAGYAFVYGARRTARARVPDRLLLLAPLIAVAVSMASGDALYGVGAVIFWYFVGALLGASEAPPQSEVEPPAPAAVRASRPRPSLAPAGPDSVARRGA